MISGSGTDINVLSGLSGKKSVVPLNLRKSKPYKFTYTVKVHAINLFKHGFFIVYIRRDRMNGRRKNA